MELARGSIGDRPWGMTLAALARRGCTGTLTIASPDGPLWISFDQGSLVGAGPVTAELVLHAAMTSRLVSPIDFAQLSRRLALAAGADPLDTLAAAAGLAPEAARRLRRRVVAECAARTFAFERGDFVVTSEVRATVEVPVDACSVIALGARSLDPRRIAAELAPYGRRFAIHPPAVGQLASFGFLDEERPVVETLRHGASLDELVLAHAGLEPRSIYPVVYALVSCLVCGPVLAPIPEPPVEDELTPRMARGTSGYPGGAAVAAPAVARPAIATGSGLRFDAVAEPEDAVHAYRRGLAALDRDDLPSAIEALGRALALAPKEIDYEAALAWARFRAAPNKQVIADETRRALVRAVGRSRSPEIAHFYLGRVERILGRDRAALQHFHEVLQLAPDHAEAATEVRVLEARVSATTRRR